MNARGHKKALPSPDKPHFSPQLNRLLTRSDRQFLDAYAQCQTLAQTGVLWARMRGAEHSDKHAKQDAWKKMSAIRTKVAEAGLQDEFWEALGLGAARIAKALSEGLGATMVKPMVVRRPVVIDYVDAKGQPRQKVSDEETIVDAGPYVDHPTRIDAAMSAARLRGDLARVQGLGGAAADDESGPPKINITITQYNVQVNHEHRDGGNGSCVPVN